MEFINESRVLRAVLYTEDIEDEDKRHRTSLIVGWLHHQSVGRVEPMFFDPDVDGTKALTLSDYCDQTEQGWSIVKLGVRS